MAVLIVYRAYRCIVNNFYELANWAAKRQRQGQHPLVRLGDKVICECEEPLEVLNGRGAARYSVESPLLLGPS